MRRDMLAVALASLWLATAVAPALAQEPSDPDSATRTLVMPRAALAATFPANWRIWTYPMEQPGAWDVIDVDGRQTCNLLFHEGATSAEETAPYGEGDEPSDRLEVLERWPLTVPAGEAMYVAWRFVFEDEPPQPIAHEYHVPASGGVLRVRCHADTESSSDRFLSIIETIGPPSEDPPASAPFDPRVEMPSLRLAVEFPEEWELSLRSDTGTGFIFGGERAFIAIDMEAEDATRCELETLADDTLLASMTTTDWRAHFDELQSQSPEWTSAEVVLAEHGLPAGSAARVEIEWSDGFSANLWILTESDRMIGLTCSSSSPPLDGWYSIAETLEILPPAK